MIPYIDRTRSYYSLLGYAPYRWAQFDDTPFTPLGKSLSASTLALITTAAPVREDAGDQGPGAAYNAAAKFFKVYTAPVSPLPDLRISHLGYDRNQSRAEDAETWLPLKALSRAVTEGLIGRIADAVIGVPTNRSQRVTMDQDAPDTLARCRDLRADIALLVPT